MLYEWWSEWMSWIIPGLGSVEGRRFDVPKDGIALSLLMMQVCRKHVSAQHRSPVAWRQFHPRRDSALITPLGTSAPFGLMPGLEGVEQEVRDYVWNRISPFSKEAQS